MTEEEAKTKWCPMTRNPLVVGWKARGESAIYCDTAVRCLASACMLWRTYKDANDGEHSYCGLGGK